MNTWPDGAMTPFRNEKNSNWEGAFRGSMMVRWPGKIKAGTVSNEIIAHQDWLPTLLAAAGKRRSARSSRKATRPGTRSSRCTWTGTISCPTSRARRRKGRGRAYLLLG